LEISGKITPLSEKLVSDDKGYFSGFSITPKEEFKDDFSRLV